MLGKVVLNYVRQNIDTIAKEIAVWKQIRDVTRVALPVLIVILFLTGAYITSRTPSSRAAIPEGFINIESDATETRKLQKTANTTEGFDTAAGGVSAAVTGENTNRCPNILIQHGNEIFLYNSKVEKVPGVNPIRFKSLDDYSEFMDWLHGRGIRCPILFLQFSYDAQGNAVYKMRPSPTDLQGGLSANVPYSPAPAALVQMMDASRDNPPFNNQMYDGFDPLNFNMGDYTPQDAAFREKELTMKYSDNPMDSNWGGIRYSESVVASGAYADRTRPDAARSDTSALVPMRVPGANEKYRNPMYAGDAVSRGRGADVEWGKARRPTA
jgi:hypothetical protein